MEDLVFSSDGKSKWAGMGDYRLISPNRRLSLELKYESEPPHGDSYHRLIIEGKTFPGFIWGCMFAFSSDSRHLVCSWMSRLFERRTVVIDLRDSRYFVLPGYIYDFVIEWPNINDLGNEDSSKSYVFSGHENWIKY